MLSMMPRKIQILFAVMLLTISGNLFSQVTEPELAIYDTTDYYSLLIPYSIDYNLMIAAAKGYTYEINRLISLGADIFAETDQGVTALIFAVSNNQTKVARLLIDFGSDVNKVTNQGETPLLIAVKNDNAEIAEALIRAGADIDVAGKLFNATPLHYAAVYDYFQTADMLLYYDAEKDKKTIEGSTPLLAATWAGNADIADLLVQKGANIEISDNEGFTPFLMAAMNGDTLIMDLLRRKGANIYATNNSKHNALALAVISDNTEATKYLLKIGDKWTDQGTQAMSPYDVAAKYRRKDILQILADNKIPGKVKYNIDQVDIMASVRFVAHDIYSGVSMSFKEPYLNSGILVGLDTKLWYSRVLIKQSEHTFYQYMNKGSVFYAGAFKNFALTNYPFRGNFEFSTSLALGYSFGNVLKGTLNSPGDKFMIIPALSFKWTNKDLSISVGADYMKTEFYHIGPVWLRAGLSYNLYFDNVRTKGKTLKWY